MIVTFSMFVIEHGLLYSFIQYCLLSCSVREVDHFQDVLKHPAYKEDPLGAITQHIQNSLSRELT